MSELSERTALETTEGAGKAGCRPHPWSACRKKARGRTTGTGGSSGLPCAMGYGLYVIFPVTGLVATVACGSSRKLSACIGAPEPHDFAVRCDIIRQRNDCA